MNIPEEMYKTLRQPTYRAGIAMSSAHRQLKSLKQTILKPHGLSMAQWSILGVIYDNEPSGITLSGIANQLNATQAFVSSNVKSLEDKQLVRREKDEQDQRVSTIRLVAGVDKQVEQIESEVRQQLRQTVYAKVSPEELAVFLHLLSVFAEVED